MQLNHWRDRIDELDAALLQLLNLRATFALEAARLKQDGGMPLRAPARESAVLARLLALNPGPLDREAVTKLYRLIMEESVRLQQHAAGEDAEPVHNADPA